MLVASDAHASVCHHMFAFNITPSFPAVHSKLAHIGLFEILCLEDAAD